MNCSLTAIVFHILVVLAGDFALTSNWEYDTVKTAILM